MIGYNNYKYIAKLTAPHCRNHTLNNLFFKAGYGQPVQGKRVSILYYWYTDLV